MQPHADSCRPTVPSHSSALPPPPPPFSGRPLLPPSSPQLNHQPRDASGLHANAVREISTPATKQSSMSISSMLGTEPTRPRETSAPAPTQMNGSMTSRAFPSSAHQSTTSSPTKSQYGSDTRHMGLSECQSSMPGSTNRFRAYSGEAPSSAKTLIKSDSPLHSKLGRLSSSNLTQISPTSDQGPPQGWRARNDRHSDPGRLLQRPSSQPNGPHAAMEEQNRRTTQALSRNGILDKRRLTREDSRLGREQEHTPDHKTMNQQSHPETQIPSSSIPPRMPFNQPDHPMHVPNYPFLSKNSIFSEPGSSGLALQNGSQSLEQKESNLQRGPWDAKDLRRIRDDRLGTAPPSQSNQPKAPPSESRPRFLDALDDRQLPDEQKYPQTVLDMERSESLDRAIQHAKEGGNGHRNSLALMLEHNRRAGRLSPFPQAVQGAQGQIHGPSRDPNIKNEFSKMFAGIGSGVSSSGLAGSGTSTPFPSSPRLNESEQRLPFSNRNDLIETHSRSRNGSRMGNKRSRKTKDDTKDVDGLGRAESGRGGKRPRHHHHGPQ